MAARILILSASVGAGHLRAAEAVEAALKQVAPDAVVRNTDVLKLTNATFRKVYGEAYLDLVNKAPHVLGFFYDVMDRPRRPRSLRDRLRGMVEKLNLSKLCDVLECESWDVIVNTHFLPAEIISLLRKDHKIHTPQITVTTDFETHRLWVNQPTDHYCTATEEGKAYLHYWGVPLENITVTGIPIDPVFAEPKDRQAMLRSHGLVGDRPIVLQLAGGFGVGPIEKLCQSILSIQRPIELVVVTGRNAKAKQQLEAVSVPQRHRAKILGFTREMDELLCVADVAVSKPGGLTTAETLARGVAMCIVNPIPGQESRNSDFLLEQGAAIKVNNIATLPQKLEKLLGDGQQLQRLKDNARKISRPRAAFDIADIALQYASAGKATR